jgi:hypothetical protein
VKSLEQHIDIETLPSKLALASDLYWGEDGLNLARTFTVLTVFHGFCKSVKKKDWIVFR